MFTRFINELILESDKINVVSSAYKIESKLEERGKSLIYKRNNKGPRHLCGTPIAILLLLEKCPRILVAYIGNDCLCNF